MVAKNWLIFNRYPGHNTEVYDVAANSKQQALNTAKALAEGGRHAKGAGMFFVYELVAGVETKVQVELRDVDIVEPHEAVEEVPNAPLLGQELANGALFAVPADPLVRRRR